MSFVHEIVETKISKHNGKIEVVRTLGLGTYVQVDGLTQSGGLVDIVWKKTLKKVTSYKSRVTSCLILGLGGGSAAKLVRKYWPEAKITGVEIDPVMVELGKKYLGLDEVEIDIKIQDALQFMERQDAIRNKRYDLILVDLYTGDQVPEKFETSNYIHLLRCHLSRLGMVVFNRLYYGEKRAEAVMFGEKLEKMFSKVDCVCPEANVMFVCHK